MENIIELPKVYEIDSERRYLTHAQAQGWRYGLRRDDDSKPYNLLVSKDQSCEGLCADNGL